MQKKIDQLREMKFINSPTNKSFLYRRDIKILALIFICVLMGIPIILFFLKNNWQNNLNSVKLIKESKNLHGRIDTIDISFPTNEPSKFERIKTKIYDNGDKYIGEFKDGKKTGQGTFTWANGDKYIGEYLNDKMHGQGTYTWISKMKVKKFNRLKKKKKIIPRFKQNQYTGEFHDGRKSGQGTLTLANGDKYVGAFKYGKKNGKGTYIYNDGDKYVGEYLNDEMHGQGTFYWVSKEYKGDKYVGEYKNGFRDGKGTYYFSNGNKYVGEWKEHDMHGQGTFYWDDGDKYVGEWKVNHRYGWGTFIKANGFSERQYWCHWWYHDSPCK